MSEKPKFPRAVALEVAREILPVLAPHCERIVVAGSLRRRRQEVGDVEILYIPKVRPIAMEGDLFRTFEERDQVDVALDEMLRSFVLRKRTNVKGSETYGAKNKLTVHALSGVPVDFFAATAENWHNYLVCRTGGAESNTRIAAAARALGYGWNPYGAGFTRLADGETIPMGSERAVFDFVRLPFLEPWER